MERYEENKIGETEQERKSERRRMAFLAAASHELRTPIAILKGQIDGMAQNTGVYKDRDKYLIKAGEIAASLQDLLQRIIMVSKIESEDYVLNKKEIDLAELVRSQIAELYESIEEKNMELNLSLSPKCRYITDPELTSIVLRNLLTNAVCFSPAGEKIKIDLLETKNGGINLKIENTGGHIPESDLEYIFDAFYRLEPSRNRKYGGSGLGLYIVREILEKQGASYKIMNTEEGVLFEIYYPVS